MNKVLLVGRLGKDPEIRTTQSGLTNASFSVAVDRRFTDSNGNRQTDWIRCVAWRQTADFIAKYFRSGMRIGIEGSIQTREYTAQDGSKRFATEVLVENVEFVESKNSADTTQKNANSAKMAENGGFTEVDDDDLPF